MSVQAKYKEIYRVLAQEIADGTIAGGEKLPSENRLAERFGVTRQTVLKALDILKIQGSIRSEQGRGTFVNAPFRRVAAAGRDRRFAYIASNLQESLAHRALLGIESVANEHGVGLLTYNTHNDAEREAEYLRRARATGVDGVLLLPYAEANRELAERVAAEMPVICLDNGFDGSSLPVVAADHFAAARMAVNALIAAGHRRIGFMLSSFALAERVRSVADRLAGYRKELEESGIEFDAGLVAELGGNLANVRPADVGLELYGYPAMHRLMCIERPPTAVLLLWDELAPGAYAAIRDARKGVPEDFSLIGFNDDELCGLLSPKLTTVRQDAEAIGRTAARLLLEALAGNPPPERTIVPGALILRESTSVPRA